MSKIGKKPITIPAGVTVAVNGNAVVVKGPKGELSEVIQPEIKVEINDNSIVVWPEGLEDVKKSKTLAKKPRSLWGLSRTLINNMITGVTTGFEQVLEVNGVGYKVSSDGKFLTLNLGFSHAIKFQIIKGIAVKVEQNKITIQGINKQKVGSVASKIRAFKKPEPYKGKGIKYAGEVILRKEGKKK